MNTLVFDIDNEAVIREIKNLSKDDTVITGTIRRPKRFPTPDVIVVNFDFVLKTNRREEILVGFAAQYHPDVWIIAFSDSWQENKALLARAFGVDLCLKYSEIDNLPLLLTARKRTVFPTQHSS